MPSTDLVHAEFGEGVYTVTLDHPKANAFNDEMVASLQTVLEQATQDERIRCVLLTGRGNFFSTGRDLKDLPLETGESFRKHLLRTFNPLILQIRNLEKPVIAAINGAAAGAGLGIALACDLRIASNQARFVVGFQGIGLSLDSAVSLLLPALIGLGRAAEFTFSNQPISARQALAWGLVNRLAPPDQLAQQAGAWAAELAQGPVRAMGLAKRAFNQAVLPDLEQVLDFEAHLQDIAGQGAEFREGLSAFLEKRAPSHI